MLFVLLYTGIVLLVLGADGANCPIQLDLWRSVYNVTFLQAYLLIVLGGYVGTLFASLLACLLYTSSYNSAVLGKNLLLDEKPGQKIHVFDSRSASVGESLIALKIEECESQGMEFEQVVETVEAYICLLYTSRHGKPCGKERGPPRKAKYSSVTDSA